MFGELQNIAFKHFGIYYIIEQGVLKLGKLDKIYITEDLARGLDTNIIDFILIGGNIDSEYLSRLIEKAKILIDKIKQNVGI